MTPIAERYIAHVLRAPAQSCGAKVVGGGHVAEPLGAPVPSHLRGAAARVVPWSLGRAGALLGHAARRPLRWGESSDIAPDTRVVINILEALGRGDEASARASAQWLVRPHAQAALLRALQPAAEALCAQSRAPG